MTQVPSRVVAIEEAISRASGVSIEDMRSKNRRKEYSEARMAVWLILYDHLGYSYPFIARVYDRDHTTIIHGVKKMRAEQASQKILEGIRKVCPDVLEKPAPNEPKTIESWQF